MRVKPYKPIVKEKHIKRKRPKKKVYYYPKKFWNMYEITEYYVLEWKKGI